MALLLIILAVFALWGLGSGSTNPGTTHAEPQRSQGLTVTDCLEVTWKAGRPAHERPCHKAPPKP